MITRISLIVCLFMQLHLMAQAPCEYSTNVNDSIGSYKSTKEFIMHERNFAGKSSYIFFALVNVDGTPYLKFQQIEKSDSFIKANCFDNRSRLYLQLANGKVVTLVHTNDEACSTLIPVSEENKHSRLLNGSFYFLKGSIEDLKTSPITLLRVRYATDTVDFALKKEFTSELTGLKYEPESYFVKYLNCIL